MVDRILAGTQSDGAAGQNPPSRALSIVQAMLLFLSIGVLGVLATFPMAWEDQAIVGGALFALAWLVHRLSKSRTATLALVVISMFTTVRYLWWRFAETYSYLSYNAGHEHWSDLVFVGLLLGAETYAFVIMALGYVQSACPLDRKPVPLPDDVAEWPSVDVLIPTFNEPISVIKPTVLAALNIDWPSDKIRIIVLDDGCRDEIKEFASRCGAEYVGRTDSRFAKAGNLNNTLRRTDGELVAIFDCDHVPTRSFLQMTAGSFLKDERLAMLQTPHHFYTPNPIERNLNVFHKVPDEGALFYGVIQKGNDFWNAASFAGSCAVLRRSALEEIGGIAVETVTEDAHTSLRLQKKGWNTAYLDIPQAAGLAAFTLRDHVNQRIRWARGLTQILRIEKPLWSSELTWAQRLCYFNSSVHFLYALPRLIFLTAPLGFLLLELSNFYGYVLAILAYALPHLFLATMTNARLQGRHRNPYWNEVFETILAPFILIPTTLALIEPRKGIFNVTPKSMSRNARRYDWLIASPFLVIAALNIVGIYLGVQRMAAGEGEVGTLVINIIWACYSTLILGVVLAMAEEPEEVRSEPRVPVCVPVFAVMEDGGRVEGESRDVSYGGVRMETPDASNLRQGGQTTVGFRVFGQDLRIPGRVVRVDKWSLQIRFANLTLAQEEALTRVIFSRADAWVAWNDVYPERFGLWKSLAHLAGLSLVGFGRVVRAVFRRAPQEKLQPMTKVSEAAGEAVAPMLALALAGGLFTIGSAMAQSPVPQAAAPVRPNATFQEVHEFAEFGVQQPIILQGEDKEAGFRFWSPLTKVVEDATIDLRYQTSPGGRPEEGSLLVLLNGAEVAALPLRGEAGSGGVERRSISLPADLFVGDNELLFVLDDGCSPSCVESAAESGWARVERSSQIELAGTRLPVALELRLLPMPLLDLSVHRPSEVTLVTSAGADAKELEAAGIAASWLGVLSDHRGVRLSSLVDELPKGHAVVVAKSGSAIAARIGLSGRTKPTLALVQNPADPYGTILALIGRDGDDVKRAAQALALGAFAKDGALVEVSDLELPAPTQPDIAPRWVDPATPIPFASFAGQSELRIPADSSLDLYIRTPADLEYGSTRRLPLTLRYFVRDLPVEASGAVTLLMNGVFVGEHKLTGSDLSREGYQEQIFPVPVEAIYPRSTLQISFSIHEESQGSSAAYPVLEILPESELDLTGFQHFAALPRLDLFANNGFPFTRRADLAETAVVLGDNPGSTALSMYFNLMALFGANTGASATRLAVMPPEQAWATDQKDILVIGELGSDVFSALSSQLSVPMDRPELAVREGSGSAEWLRLLSWGNFQRQRRELSRALRTSRVDAILQGSESKAGRAVVAIGLRTAEAPVQMAEAMRGFSNSGSVYGTTTLLSEGELQSFAATPATFYVGAPTLRANVDLWLRRFLWVLPLLALAFAFVLARIVRVRLERATAVRLEALR
ncbi:MAG: UDP-forming cellulose synthase catalytic subunit [Bryobacterales bacterium]